MVAVDRAYLLLTIERTGSNLLSDALTRTGRAGRVGEYFNHGRLHQWALDVGAAAKDSQPEAPRLTSLASYVDAMAERFGVDGTFAAKVHWQHFERLRRQGMATTPLDLVPSSVREQARVVLLLRRDHHRQAISILLARRSGVYAVLSKTGEQRGVEHADVTSPAVTPEMTPEMVAALNAELATIAEGERGWNRWTEMSERPVMRLTYEELCDDYEDVVRRVLRYVVDVEIDADDVPSPRIRVQRDQTTEQILERWTSASPAPRRGAGELS